MKLTFKNYLTAVCLALAIFGLNGCVKDRNPGATDFNNLTPTVLIVEGGLAKFSSSSLLFPAADSADAITFRVNYAATTVAPRDITVTLAVNTAAIAAYNLSDTTHPDYKKFPDSIYAGFPTIKVVIKKGQQYSDPVKLVLYPNKVDPSINYMLPISIVDGDGITIATNFSTVYYHLIGNPLAGAYNEVGTRYNYTGGVVYSGPIGPYPQTNSNIPAGFIGTTNLGTVAVPGVKVASPIDSKTITMSFSNLGFGSGFEYGYLIKGNANFSSITVGYNVAFTSANQIKATYLMSYTPPSPTQKPAFRIVTHYNNNAAGAGNDRIIDESFVHQ